MEKLRRRVAVLEGALLAAAKSLDTTSRMFRDVPENDMGCAHYATNRAEVAYRDLKDSP